MPASSSSPSVLLGAVTGSGLPSESLGATESIGLLQALSAVPDPRQARGRRHSLQSSLLLAVGAVLAGARSYAAIAQWARYAEQAVRVCGPTPHATTFGRVLAAVDAAALQRALTGWVLTRRQDRQRQRAQHVRPRGEVRPVVAVDGKTLRGARDGPGGQAKLIAVFDHAEGLALTQAEVSGGDELAAFTAVLDTVLTCPGPWSPPMPCTASGRARTICTTAEPTTCSPPGATSRRCVARWPGCPGPR